MFDSSSAANRAERRRRTRVQQTQQHAARPAKAPFVFRVDESPEITVHEPDAGTAIRAPPLPPRPPLPLRPPRRRAGAPRRTDPSGPS